MDQNPARDDVTGAQPPGGPAGGEPSPWGQQDQQAAQDAAQPETGAPDQAAAEYAAWSADTSYSQQAAQPEGTYYAPEPQSATYSDPAAYPQQAAQGYDQAAYQQQYDQQYAQQQQYAQGYDQAAYQPQQYAQQQYAQQQYAQQQYAQGQQPGYYDPQAYGQQQYPAGYGQQAYGQQPGYYDPQAYTQQPSYYDQQAYAQQQQYPAGYGQYQQAGQPYAYAQPGQQPWPGEYWDAEATGYGRSFLAVLAGFVLLTWGLVMLVGGALVMWIGNINEFIPADMTFSPEAQEILDTVNREITGFGGILLMVGIIQVVGALGIWAHRKWGRAFGVILGLLGTLLGIGWVISSVTFNVGDQEVAGMFTGNDRSLAIGVVVLVTYLLVLLAMFVGRRHFRRRGVSS